MPTALLPTMTATHVGSARFSLGSQNSPTIAMRARQLIAANLIFFIIQKFKSAQGAGIAPALSGRSRGRCVRLVLLALFWQLSPECRSDGPRLTSAPSRVAASERFPASILSPMAELNRLALRSAAGKCVWICLRHQSATIRM